MAKFSTGLRNGMLDNTPLRVALAGGTLRLFSGTAPATADAAETGALLLVLTNGGGASGLTLDAAEEGVISKAAAEVWSTNAAVGAGTATHFRLVQASDSAAASNTAARIQGSVGTVGTDMVLTNPAVAMGLPWILNYFNIALPTET